MGINLFFLRAQLLFSPVRDGIVEDFVCWLVVNEKCGSSFKSMWILYFISFDGINRQLN